MKIAIIGAGSWGTAMAGMLAEKHQEVMLWARDSQLAEQMKLTRKNERYLPEITLPTTLSYTNDIAEAAVGAQFIVIATPSHAVRETASRLADIVTENTIIITAAKGLELSSLKRMSEVIAEEIPSLSDRIAVLSGPNHAEEVGLKQPTATVVAAASRTIAEQVQDIFMTPYFRVYTNPDIVGVELGGALKNIIALGAGIADGLGLGDNAKAALITRGLAEIARLGIALQANPLTFAGLSGIGDLMVTCTSKHSRNRRAGILLAQGKSAKEIEAGTGMVVEGIRATSAAYHLAKLHNVDMPITEQTYQVLYANKSAKEAVMDLMTRGRTHEVEEVVVGDWGKE